MVNRQSSIVNRQSSIVNRQSSIVNRQSSIVNRQSSIVNRQSSIVNRQSSIVNRQSLFSSPQKRENSNPHKQKQQRDHQQKQQNKIPERNLAPAVVVKSFHGDQQIIKGIKHEATYEIRHTGRNKLNSTSLRNPTHSNKHDHDHKKICIVVDG